jgi:hypothetical protein
VGVTVFHQAPLQLFALCLPAIFGLGVAMYFFLEFGSWMGRKHLRSGRSSIQETLGVIDGPIFALFGLLIAFTFSSALNRFDDRRKLIVEEANDIGTAYLRLDLLPVADREVVQGLFRSYVDSRIKTYELIPDMTAVVAEYSHTQDLQAQIWKDCVNGAAKTSNTLAGMQLLPAINAMIDITSTRTAAMQFHPPLIIFGMLMVMSLVTAVLVGYQMAGLERRSWLHVALFIITITLTCYVILDIEYPRIGLIRMDATDVILRDVRESMGPR